ncbi:hypothetical protein AJ79_05647 [Helicocarpus griseus UAMH5409]|uniref:Uncharacterized protein n=1 Tax=Helicocarpus griseus UAMH5409 TaxID=1447875 RepID=A0A2B7XLD0_9EURO|nr:hypothetical protein AJ79_05647 [Helicocarpus griseus UAMH5409]
MAYTEVYMLGYTTDCGSLPSIGSSAQNVARQENDSDFANFINETREAETIRNIFGEGAYQGYIEKVRTTREAIAVNDARTARLANQQSSKKRSRFRRWLHRVKLAYTGENPKQDLYHNFNDD